MKHAIILLVLINIASFYCACSSRNDNILEIVGAWNLGFIPHSDTIVYIIDHSSKVGDFTVYKRGLDKKNPQIPLTDGDSAGYNLIFSPKGDKYATTDRLENKYGIWIYAIDKSTSPRYIPTRQGVITDLKWSPQGDYIAYCAEEDWNTAHIWLVEIANEETRQLTFDDTYDNELTWMHNGEEIIYSRNRANSWEIWNVNVNTLQTQELVITEDKNDLLSPYVSPDGRYLFWLRGDGKGKIQVHMKDFEENREYLANYGYDDIIRVMLSSDGRRIAFNTTGKDTMMLIIREFRLTDFERK